MGKYDGQACPAIVFSHMAYLRYKKPNDHLIITDLLMESNPHLINTNHIILYIYYTPIIVQIVPFKIVHTQTTFMGTPLFVVTNCLPLFVARDILSRYGVYRWDSYNGKASHRIISGPYSIVSGEKMVYCILAYLGGIIGKNTI